MLSYRRLDSNVIVQPFKNPLNSEYLIKNSACNLPLWRRSISALVLWRCVSAGRAWFLCVGCAACRGRDSAIRNGWGGGLPGGQWIYGMGVFLWFGVGAFAALYGSLGSGFAAWGAHL